MRNFLIANHLKFIFWEINMALIHILCRYVWKGKIGKLRNYFGDIYKHKKINRVDEYGRSALHYAASWADINIIRLLLTIQGINLNMKDAHGKTPLFKAVEMRSLACVKLLVEAGAKARITCCDERDVLQYAITEYGDECFPIIEYLYKERGLKEMISDKNNMTYLHLAAIAKKHVSVQKIIEMLVESGAELDPVEGNRR